MPDDSEALWLVRLKPCKPAGERLTFSKEGQLRGFRVTGILDATKAKHSESSRGSTGSLSFQESSSDREALGRMAVSTLPSWSDILTKLTSLPKKALCVHCSDELQVHSF